MCRILILLPALGILLLPGAHLPIPDEALVREISRKLDDCDTEYREQARKYVECHEKLKAIQRGTSKDLGKEGEAAFDAIVIRYYDAADAILKAEKDCNAAAKTCSRITSKEGLDLFVERMKRARSRPLGCYYVKGLGHIRHESIVEALLMVLREKYPWRCRVSALDALGKIKGRKPEIIAQVQECLSDSDTRIVRGANDAFTKLTGARAAGGGKGGSGGVRATFYNLDIDAKSVIFVVDSSNSMKGNPDGSKNKGGGKKKKKGDGGMNKFAVMKRELKNAIKGLPDGALVNIVDFNALIYVMSPRMLELSPATRPKIDAYIDNMRMFFATNICEALSTAMMIALGVLSGDIATGRESAAVDAIFFLTDGKPVVPKRFKPDHGVSKTNEILSRMKFWNRDLRISVNVIGIGAGGDFLPKMAKEHNGKYATP